MTAVAAARRSKKPSHTPNGFDPRWVDAINAVLEDRGSPVRVVDFDDGFWSGYIARFIDAIEDGEDIGVETVQAEG